MRNKPNLNPHSVSELFGPNPDMLTATEARSVTITLARTDMLYSQYPENYLKQTIDYETMSLLTGVMPEKKQKVKMVNLV